MPNADARSEALRSAPLDSWIALSDDETRIVATGKTYEEVTAELDRLGDETAVLLKTPEAWHPLAV
jgi:TPP-dependent indolepyruvate ferredoxin oxidoreductase alpha subunit